MEGLKDPLLRDRTPASLPALRRRPGGSQALSQELPRHGFALHTGVESLDYEASGLQHGGCIPVAVGQISLLLPPPPPAAVCHRAAFALFHVFAPAPVRVLLRLLL